MKCASKHLPVGLPVVIIAAVLAPQTSVGGELRNLISDLYGGDGIQVIAGPTHHPFEPSFEPAEPRVLEEFNDLSDDIARNVAFAPFNSSATSIVFDIERGVPVREEESLGPILLQRADTIGANRVSFGLSYTRIDYDRFEGDDLGDLEVTLQHTDCCPLGGDGELGSPGFDFELDQIELDLDLEIEQDIFAFFGTYGITNDWDVSAVVPVVHIDAAVRSVATLIDPTPGVQDDVHIIPTTGEDAGVDTNDGEETGIGDVILRSKYNFLSDQPILPDTAVVGQVTLPTGDDDELLGTGETGFLGLLVASKDFGRFTLNANAGYEVYTGSVLNSARYGVGGEVLVVDDVTAVAEVFGRYEPNGDGSGDNVDGLVGAKWNPIGELVVSGYLVTPVNRDTGLRSELIWGLGVEFGF